MTKLEVLPKGFRFRPTDEELISHYLRLKINGRHSAVNVIPDVDVCKWEPWDLPVKLLELNTSNGAMHIGLQRKRPLCIITRVRPRTSDPPNPNLVGNILALSVIKSDDPEWFFFCPRDRKYPNGHRSNRATEAGYWKATGKDRTIKSRKLSAPGCADVNLIGMKKTLVFYKGRAPKGERTNWIIHEYRATEPDLNASIPGQGDYVLCRLFHKADERLENSKFDEAEPTESSPSINKSSPDDAASDLLEDPIAHGFYSLKESEDVKKHWTYEGHNTTPIVACEYNAVQHLEGEPIKKVYAPPTEIPVSTGAAYHQSEKILDALQSYNYTDVGACIGSPYDFGSANNGLHFEDGASEQDVLLSELLEGFHNNGHYFSEESTGPKNFSVSESLMLGLIDGADETPSAIFNMNDTEIHGDHVSKTVQVQGQKPSGFFQFTASSDPMLSHEGSLKTTVEGSHDKPDAMHPIKDGSEPSFNGTGIMIRARQPKNPTVSVNSKRQGSTSRRIRLLRERRQSRVFEDHKSSEGQECQPLTGAPISIYGSRQSQDSDEKYEFAQTGDLKLELPVKPVDDTGSTNEGLVLSTSLYVRGGTRYVKVYAVCIYLAIILAVLVLRMWRAPGLHGPTV